MNSKIDIRVDCWKVTILPLPKRYSRGAALGFCGGFAVGQAEALRGKTAAIWWPEGKPELLALEGYKEVGAALAHGTTIPGALLTTITELSS